MQNFIELQAHGRKERKKDDEEKVVDNFSWKHFVLTFGCSFVITFGTSALKTNFLPVFYLLYSAKSPKNSKQVKEKTDI